MSRYSVNHLEKAKNWFYGKPKEWNPLNKDLLRTDFSTAIIVIKKIKLVVFLCYDKHYNILKRYNVVLTRKVLFFEGDACNSLFLIEDSFATIVPFCSIFWCETKTNSREFTLKIFHLSDCLLSKQNTTSFAPS